jgi:hypothetical protein
MLNHLCERLSSQCNCTNEPLNAVDETRREAKLLMNLLRSSSSSPSKADNSMKAVSMDRSPSDQSFLSDHSTSSRSKRKGFSFTCPSLSLVEDTSSYASTSMHGKDQNATEKRQQGEISFHLPAHLMGRPLKVDDRDAIRLSADAMARNVLQSIQKTLDHRIQTWIYALSKKLVHYEHQMITSGATIDDLKPLVQLPEATLLVALQKLQQQRGVATESAHTTFEILSQRIDSLEVESNDRHQRVPNRTSSSSSASCNIVNNHHVSAESLTDRNSSQDSIQSGSTITSSSSCLDSYSYIVAHQLRFVCTVHLQTLLGYTEIEMIVPGSIAGCFVSSELDPTADLVSVTIDIDTKILISLIDKACRTVLRSSIEKLITQPDTLPLELNDDVTNTTETTHSQVVPTKQSTEHDENISITSPPMNTTVIQKDSVFVTPGPLCPDHLFHHSSTAPTNVLLPMPDDLNDYNNPSNKKPRRISPQPISSCNEYYNSSSNMSSTGSDDGISIVPLNTFDMDTSRPNKLKRRTSSSESCCCLDSTMNCDTNHYCNVSSSSLSSSSLDDYGNHITSMTKQTSHTTSSNISTKHRLVPLISPQYNSNNTKKLCHVPTNGPSLPMLVEVACREILGVTNSNE